MRNRECWLLTTACVVFLPILLAMPVSDVQDPKRTANRFVQDSAGLISAEVLSRNRRSEKGRTTCSQTRR